MHTIFKLSFFMWGKWKKAYRAGMIAGWTRPMAKAIGYHHSFIKLACTGITVALLKRKGPFIGQGESLELGEGGGLSMTLS